MKTQVMGEERECPMMEKDMNISTRKHADLHGNYHSRDLSGDLLQHTLEPTGFPLILLQTIHFMKLHGQP